MNHLPILDIIDRAHKDNLTRHQYVVAVSFKYSDDYHAIGFSIVSNSYHKFIKANGKLSFNTLLNNIIIMLNIPKDAEIKLVCHNIEELHMCTNFRTVFLRKNLDTVVPLNRAFLEIRALSNKYKMNYRIGDLDLSHHIGSCDQIDKIIEADLDGPDTKKLWENLKIVEEFRYWANLKDYNRFKYLRRIFGQINKIEVEYQRKQSIIKKIRDIKAGKINKDRWLDSLDIGALERNIKLLKGSLIQNHNLRHKGNKIYGSFIYRSRQVKLIDTSLLSDKNFYKASLDFNLPDPIDIKSKNIRPVNIHCGASMWDIEHYCHNIALQNFRLYIIINDTIKKAIQDLIFDIIEQDQLLCDCNIKYCNNCKDSLTEKINKKTFFTLCSISEFITIALSKTNSLIGNYNINIPDMTFEHEDKPYISWKNYFKCPYKIDVVGPNNSQYLIGKYENYNIYDIDINSAYPSIMTNIFNRVYDFSKEYIIRKESSIKDKIKELNAKNAPFLVKVRFKYKQDYLYTAIPTENDLNAVLFLSSGISKYITSFEYNRLLEDKNVCIKPTVIKYFNSYKLNTPFSSLMHSLRAKRIQSSAAKQEVLSRAFKLINNGIYGKLLQIKNPKKSNYSLNTGKMEESNGSQMSNPYLANLVVGGCRAVTAEIQSKMYMNNIEIASSITDGCLLVTQTDEKKVREIVEELNNSKFVSSILSFVEGTKPISFKSITIQGNYIGVKKRLEGIYNKNYQTVKQSIGPFSHNENINVCKLYDTYVKSEAIYSIKLDKHSIRTLIEQEFKPEQEKKFIPNLDPNTDKLPSVAGVDNYKLIPFRNLAEFLYSKKYCEYKASIYRYVHKLKTIDTYINGYMHKIKARKNLESAINLDNVRLGGFAESECVFVRLIYMILGGTDAKEKAKEGKKHYGTTYYLAKKLNLLCKKGPSRKWSDSNLSEKINKRFITWLAASNNGVNNISMMYDSFVYMSQEITKKYTLAMELAKEELEKAKLDKTLHSAALKPLREHYKKCVEALKFIKASLVKIKQTVRLCKIDLDGCVTYSSIMKKLLKYNINMSSIISNTYRDKLKHARAERTQVSEDYDTGTKENV